MSINEIRKTRIRKLENIRQAGLNPYPAQVKRTHTCQEAIDSFEKLLADKEGLFLVGRLQAIREHGGSTFTQIRDGSGEIQAYFKKDQIGDKEYKFFQDNFDLGDFVEAQGELFLTKKGEKTLLVKDYRILTKGLLPLPEKWHGLKDVEERFRKRYLDLIMNKETKEIFKKRSEIIKKLRGLLESNKFIEVETPILQSLYGGASAKPFKTHLNALDMELYLRVAPELYLKRLLVGGLERVFEIGRCFRNEGMDREHNPDFTMLEFYAAYWDWEDLMKFVEQIMHQLDAKVFPEKWDRVEYKDVVKNDDIKGSFAKLEKPTFVLHLPDIPLCKDGQAFQGIVQGVELFKAFSEQNDSMEQRKVFEQQEALRKKGDEEAQRLDSDFLEALEYGMPPAAGIGIGIDRLAILLTEARSVRESILFPLMKPK
ncbi:MAG: lysine--tRNA ligase [Parcubacteria group bacterium]|jgi:lysyl-tRNA synthetase class 2|nr:lysine--tRNA ligase [Parcubacteria group bacterium]|tara:strand:+ start:7147 stop:8427 length:1281 start_codon:yes stop_codon:yes gene_type:complete